MLDQKVAALLNEQVNKEFYSAYLYLDFSSYYDDIGLDGFSNWYRIQAQEERDHAMLFLQYLQNNGCKVTLDAIQKPDKELKDKLMAEGLLCLTAGKDTLRLLPPLVITKEEIDKGLAVMAKVMK